MLKTFTLFLVLFFLYANPVWSQDQQDKFKGEIDSLKRQLNHLNYKIDSVKNVLATQQQKKGFWASLRTEGPKSYTTSRPELVATSWVSLYMMGARAKTSYVDMLGTGVGFTVTNMLLRYFSITAFTEASTFQGFNPYGKKETIYNEQQVHGGALVSLYLHTLWGGMPKTTVNLQAGVDGGLRFLDKNFSYVKPIDRTLGLRWGVELTRPMAARKSYMERGPVAFWCLGFQFIEPVERYGRIRTSQLYIKISANPFSKKKVISPYFQKI